MPDARDRLTRTSNRLLEVTDEVRDLELEKRKTPIGSSEFERLGREIAAWSGEAADLAFDEAALARVEKPNEPGETIDDRAEDRTVKARPSEPR